MAAAKIPDWRIRLRGAWLIKIGDTIISSVEDASSTLGKLDNSGAQSVTLQFSHPESRPNLSRNGLPILSSAPFTQHVQGPVEQLVGIYDVGSAPPVQ